MGQSKDELLPETPPKVPAAHIEQAEAPETVEKVPAEQLEQTVADDDEYAPGLQLLQLDDVTLPVTPTKVPVGHEEHLEAPAVD